MPLKDPIKRAEYQKKYRERTQCDKKRYEDNKGYFRKNAIKNRHKLKQWYNELKKGLICSICGESDSRVLQFHHINKDEKVMEVSCMVRSCLSRKRILDEINKCQVLCFNCHVKVHIRK